MRRRITRFNQATTRLDLPNVDVSWFGAKCDGVADDTAAWAAAVAAVSAAGGGLITFTGTSIASQINLKSKVGIRGKSPQASILKHKVGRAADEHLIRVVEADARNVHLRDFAIDGQRTSQTGLATGIYIDNHDAVGNTNFRCHLIRNVTISQVAGTGIFLGYQIRGTLVDNVNLYYCDEYGIFGDAFSDSTITNVDSGQAGRDGVYLRNCFNLKLSNIKSWYSGRLTAGSAGVRQRNGTVSVYSNITTQENSGHGMQIYGPESAVHGVVVSGLNSDSDNTQATTANFGLSLNNVHDSIFDMTVASEAPAAATVYAAVAFTNSTGNKVRANIKPGSVTYPVTGSAIADNDIDLCRGIISSTPTTSFVADPYRYREHRVTQAGNLTVTNPATLSANPPVGTVFRFVFIQDATGGRTLTWGSAWKIPASVKLNTAANSRTVIDFECMANGDWQMVGFVTDTTALAGSFGSIELGGTDTTLTRSAAGKVAVEGVELMDANTIHALTAKATPVDDDELVIVDSAASHAMKKWTIAAVKTWLTDLTLTLKNKTLEAALMTGIASVAQSGELRLFNTTDQTTNYERGRLAWASNVFTLSADAPGGTGTTRPLELLAASNSFQVRPSGGANVGVFRFVGSTNTADSHVVRVAGTYGPTSGRTVLMSIEPTINGSSTMGYTALLINPTETATGSGAKKLIDAQVGGASKFSVDNAGAVFMANVAAAPATPTGGGVLYVEAGALKYKGSSGTVTTLGPA